MSEWSQEKIILEAQREPERIKFWLIYHRRYLDACRAVVENPPSFDRVWREQFPTRKVHQQFAALVHGGWVRLRKRNRERWHRLLARRMGQRRGWRPRKVLP